MKKAKTKLSCIVKLLSPEKKILLGAVEKFGNQSDDVFHVFHGPFKVIKHFYATLYDFYDH